MIVRTALALGLTGFVLAPQPVAAQAMDCATRAERMQAMVQTDIRTRNVAQSVGERLLGELREAVTHCRAGRAAQGEAIIRQINSNFGYRVTN